MNVEQRVDLALGEELRLLMARYPDRADCGRYEHELEVSRRSRARGLLRAWYELFPRSWARRRRARHLRDAERRAARTSPRWASTWSTCRRSTPSAAPTARAPTTAWSPRRATPAAPRPSATSEGGHTAIQPSLGTLEDFARFVAAARRARPGDRPGHRPAVSPDHPWVEEHPEWFRQRPDGTIKYAENPPKKYQDIYPLDFEHRGLARGSGTRCWSVVRFWIEHGVRIFRVDNPHTKPLALLGLADRRGASSTTPT